MPYKEFSIAGIGTVKVYKWRRSRSLRLTVSREGQVRVSIPTWTPYQAGLTFTMERRNWILAQPRQVKKLLIDGQAVGKTRHLRFEASDSVSTVKTGVRTREVVINHHPALQTTHPAVQRAAEAACWRALRAETVLLLTPRLNELAARHGFSYRSLSVKRMKTRWGSCDQHSNIVLNLFLVQLPWECIDYVILHELTHTRVLSHGPNFWQELTKVMPNAHTLRRTMRMYQPALLPAS